MSSSNSSSSSSFCPANVSVFDADDAVSVCFHQTLGSVLLFLVAVAALPRITSYIRESKPLDPNERVNRTAYWGQLLLVLLLLLEPLFRLSLSSFSHPPFLVFDFEVLLFFLDSASYSVSLFLVHSECTRHLGGGRRCLGVGVGGRCGRGHSALLRGFWVVAFARQNAFFADWPDGGFWRREDWTERDDFNLWLVRYLATGLSLVASIVSLAVVGNVIARSGYEMIRGDNVPSSSSSSTSWRAFGRKMRQLVEFLWPTGNTWLQFLAVFCLLIVGAVRVINVYVPIYSKMIVDDLSNEIGRSERGNPIFRFCWDYIVVYAILKFLQGGGPGSTGILNNLRSFLWIRVQQFTSKRVQVTFFAHLHSLSLGWHLNRKTGEVLRIMDRGRNSLNTILEQVFFNIAPAFLDVVVAIFVLASEFNVWFGVVAMATLGLYIYSTLVVVKWRTKFRRDMNEMDNRKNQKTTDSLLNFENVKYYNNDDFEIQGFRSVMEDFQKIEYKSNASLSALNILQSADIQLGLLAGSMYCAYLVAYNLEGLTSGDYVLFSTYLVQLFGPLGRLGMFYAQINQSFIDMENMFQLFDEVQSVQDEPYCPDLNISEGAIEFRDVHFSYLPSKPVLRGISFTVPPGRTVALVGPSGGGKSTVVRLLFRFYDLNQGEIRIDGQDLKQVSQKSLRNVIGVVPQDTVLFNNDIRYNIRYGRLGATDAEVEAAAKAADIHDRITTFPKGYETKVGERGLRLSGGEKQRVALARTILKAPRVVLLDEATSALDTETERRIQESLDRVCEGRTTVVVAHRLSTVVAADEILVLKEGVVVERGRHEDLLAKRGVYAGMWEAQLRGEEEEEEDERLIGLSEAHWGELKEKKMRKKARSATVSTPMQNRPSVQPDSTPVPPPRVPVRPPRKKLEKKRQSVYF